MWHVVWKLIVNLFECFTEVDNTVRENKNSAMLAYLSWLVSSRFRAASMLFGQVGHTHNRLGWRLTSYCCM